MRRTVAWLHGYTMSSAIWPQLWSLLPEADHVGIDLPGHGERAGERMPKTLDEWALVVAEDLRRSGARDLVGLSFGSSIAVQVAANHPDLVDRLVLGAPTLSGAADDRAARAKYFLLMMRMRELGPGRDLARVWMSDPPPIFRGLRRDEQRYAAMEQIVAAHPFTELRTGAMSALSATVQDATVLARVRATTLILVGTEDMPQFRANAEIIAEQAPDATVVVLPGAGHLPLLEQPDRCAHLLSDFWGQPVPARVPVNAVRAS
ncbi:alpha/beta hydrolase [Nostocoides veronense]|uniref:alpha/beta fold hydrolase n=1 Tax=Nostocoides veronense TaxID=330836 RepID=UPI0031D57A3C